MTIEEKINTLPEEAKAEALEKMNPAHTKTKYVDIKSLSNTIYKPTLDAVAVIYRATLA